MDLQLDGKAARVTGTSKGIGRHVAEHLAAKGTQVAITVWTPGPLELSGREIQSATGRGAHLPVDGAGRKVSMGW